MPTYNLIHICLSVTDTMKYDSQAPSYISLKETFDMLYTKCKTGKTVSHIIHKHEENRLSKTSLSFQAPNKLYPQHLSPYHKFSNQRKPMLIQKAYPKAIHSLESISTNHYANFEGNCKFKLLDCYQNPEFCNSSCQSFTNYIDNIHQT